MPFKLGKSDKPKTDTVDLDKLYHAVAVAESGNCSTAWHTAANNCVSIMAWTNGKRHLKKFASIAESKAEWKALWTKRFGNSVPTLHLAGVYVCGPGEADSCPEAYGWLATVKKVYYGGGTP